MTKINDGYMSGNPLTRAHATDAGQDIRANKKLTIGAFESALVGTGTFIALPKDCVGLIWSRSGLASKHGIEVGAGCIDEGYRGEVKVLLHNLSSEPFQINKGDRIAQLLTIPIFTADFIPVDNLPEAHDRGESGFGSTGVA